MCIQFQVHQTDQLSGPGLRFSQSGSVILTHLESSRSFCIMSRSTQQLLPVKPAMEVDPLTNKLRTMNGLAPGSAITDAHRTHFVQTMTAQLAQISGPIQR